MKLSNCSLSTYASEIKLAASLKISINKRFVVKKEILMIEATIFARIYIMSYPIW